MTASDRPSTWGWPRVRLAIAWIALALAVGLRGHQAWRNFNVDERADGNQGHTLIDFGGQYMFGRMLLEGHGRGDNRLAHRWVGGRDRLDLHQRRRSLGLAGHDPQGRHGGEGSARLQKLALGLVQFAGSR